jgi:glycosyltransferase involved in cell wall biosynthesis
LFTIGAPVNGNLSSARMHEARYSAECLELLRVREMIGAGFSLVHDHSGSFFASGNGHRAEVPVLATLHLPRAFYPARYFQRVPANVFFNCVSKSQARTFSDLPSMIGSVMNGIALERFPLQTKKEDYLLWLGRICEEKGTHLALDVAEKSGLPIVIAGSVYPLAYHRDYFDRAIVPRLQRMGASALLIQSPSFAEKVKLLQNAKAVLITSSAEETSSLVAMEAAACGTPVIAFKRGALPEVVDHGKTGMLVKSAEQMLAAIRQVRQIRPELCRFHAEKHFPAKRMADDYQRIYAKVLDLARSKRVEPEKIAA